jgi:hypothetical protein
MAYTPIDKSNDYFNPVIYTGTGATQSITSLDFQPDLVWIKGRSVAYNHRLFDSIRGAGTKLSSDTTSAESTDTNEMSAFLSNGFTLGSDAGTNGSGATYVSWNWLGGGTAVSNTAGDIASQVSANTTAGFSVVTYTGTGLNATVGHGLGAVPKMVIIKSRSNVTDWIVGNTNIGWTKLLRLNTTDAEDTNNYFNDTAPTTDVFSLGTTVNVNGNGYTYVAYCFAEVKGFSKFGSYTGNGSADGTFVYTGFKPAYFVIKRTDTTENWYCTDIKRNPINPVTGNLLLLNKTDAEISTSYPVDFLSNGFKIRGNNNITNASGGTYIYMAFAENPFVTSTANGSIPATAR